MALICTAPPVDAPIVSSYNDRIRPLLDCVDKLRHLEITQEGIQLPTIVVVGDQSSGKSSVLESLAGISLPRGQGICTRVPLIMRLKNVSNLGEPELQLEFNGDVVQTDEASVAADIVLATDKIAGRGCRISNTPLTLTVKKYGVPDLTMVDLPGITRVPVAGQPEDIYEQISNTVTEAWTAFMRILSSAKQSLMKVVVRGEYEEFPDDKEMHCSARLVEMLNRYSAELRGSRFSFDGNNFLMDEIMAIEEAKGIGLPNFLSRGVFLSILQKRVKGISTIPEDFVAKLWDYIENILVKVVMQHSDDYPQLQSCMRRTAQNLIAKKKEKSVDWVAEIIGMEMLTDYSCNPDYTTTWNKLMEKQVELTRILNDQPSKASKINIDGRDVEIGHLRPHRNVVPQAFDMGMRVIAYWKIVLMRMVDSMALHITFSIHKLVNKEMEEEIVADLMAPNGGGIERMLEESPMVAGKRYRLAKSVKLLKESKDVVANIIHTSNYTH